MTTPMSHSEPGGDIARVRCLYCGGNNFPASATCWQCGRPLKAGPGAASPSGPAGVSAPPSLATGPALSTSFPAPAPSPRLPAADTALAPRAAAALGLMFPYVGLPAGMLFLMLDDPRKTQLGWLLIGWSVLGSILNGIALLVTLLPLWSLLKGAHPAVPTGIPGVPSLGGDGTGLLLPWLLARHFS